MKERIYTIPVNDAFHKDCECPICEMKQVLETNAVEYTMGPSYMEGDIRAKTDALGFCMKHAKEVYALENRLGMALILKTHFDKVIEDVKKYSQTPGSKKFLFKKQKEKSPVVNYIEKLDESCFVCDKIHDVFKRYLSTVLYMWKKDSEFREVFKNSKGFCTEHYKDLYQTAEEELSGQEQEEFKDVINTLYVTNMERVRDDLAWFINKNDYKYASEPWKNAKDAIPRALTKSNSIIS